MSDDTGPREREASTLFANAAHWDRARGWQGAWVEQQLGGLRVTVPGHWERTRTRDAEWIIPDRAVVTISMFGFEKRAPKVQDHVRWMLGTDRGRFRPVGTRDIEHPHGADMAGYAVELFEHAPQVGVWPVQWLRLAAWTGTSLLGMRLDLDGLPPEDVGADFAKTWRSLR